MITSYLHKGERSRRTISLASMSTSDKVDDLENNNIKVWHIMKHKMVYWWFIQFQISLRQL